MLFASLFTLLPGWAMSGERIAPYEKSSASEPIGIETPQMEFQKYFKLGLSLMEEARWDEAIEEFKKAIEINPGDAEVHKRIGIAYGKKNMLGLALYHLKKSMELNPGQKGAEELSNIVQSLEKSGIRPEEPSHVKAKIQEMLGLKVQSSFHGGGVIITEVEFDSPAFNAGLRQGDIIIEVNRKEIRDLRDYYEEIGIVSKGDVILFLIKRKGYTFFVACKIN